MDIKDLLDVCSRLAFDDHLEEGDEIQCPDCKEFSSHKDWIESDVGCEDCGTHIAIQCPKCDRCFDTVFMRKPQFHIRETEETRRILIEKMRQDGFDEEQIKKIME